jgi:hypothetical protein
MAVGILLRFQKEGPAGIAQAVTQRTPSAGAVTAASHPRSSPAEMFGARGSLMGFTTPMVTGVFANDANAAIRASCNAARDVSGNDAFGGLAGNVPDNQFYV